MGLRCSLIKKGHLRLKKVIGLNNKYLMPGDNLCETKKSEKIYWLFIIDQLLQLQ